MYFTSVHLRFIKPKESYPVKLKEVRDEWNKAWEEANKEWLPICKEMKSIYKKDHMEGDGYIELKWWQKLFSVRLVRDQGFWDIAWNTHRRIDA